MLLDICRKFIQSGIEKNNFMEYCKVLKSLILIKYMTIIHENNSELSKRERKHITGFTLPHTANFNYIIKYIDTPRLYEIISDAFVKIEKRNIQYKNQIALRKEITSIDLRIDGIIEKKQVIISLEELALDYNLFLRLLNEINDMDEEEFELINNFLDDDIYDLYNEHTTREKKAFEDKRMTIFKGDIPISVNNSRIFDKTFIVEQWIRRIIMFVLMTEYGEDWINVFEDDDLNAYEKMRRKLSGREILDFKDDHLLWYASISYLARFIERKDISEKIENVTDMKASKISTAFFKVGDIRNEMAHNRTITKFMEEDYNNNFKVLEETIINFKKNTIYSETGVLVSDFGIASNQCYEFITYFNKLAVEQFDSIGTQSLINEEKHYYSIILLPCKPLGGEFIDSRALLERFDTFKDYIVAFYINKEVCEYQVIVSKKIETQKMIYKSIMHTFFEIVESVGTNTPYELQDSKYTCNPKIWFYENSHADGLRNGLW